MPMAAMRRIWRQEEMVERHYTYREIAELLSLSERTVRRLIDRCELRHIRVGRAVRVPASALEQYVESVTVRPV
jgi:excisionase family DNA binding protein